MNKKVILIAAALLCLFIAIFAAIFYFIDRKPTYEPWSDTLKSSIRTFCMKTAVESGFETQFGKPPASYCECLIDRIEKLGGAKVEALETKPDDMTYTAYFSGFFASPEGEEAKRECLEP